MLRERQITFGSYGHTLNHRQAISPDGQWAVYDTRNDDGHISRTSAIEMVHLESGEIVRLYQTVNQSEFGPGVGAASFHPHKPLVAFIHGLENCTSEKPYTAARRFGAMVDINVLGKFVHAEARSVFSDNGFWARPFGALSGGTHAHSWSRDGWLSFTYNDAWLEHGSQLDRQVRNQRTVGFMVPGFVVHGTFVPWIRMGDQKTEVPDPECFDGSFVAFLAASLCTQARNGSDDIEAAMEECWLGGNKHCLAFLAAVRGDSGELVNEIFVCELPNGNEWNEIAARVGSPHVMDANELLKPVTSCVQRRLTHTLHRRFPGVQGPRCWLVSSSDGKFLFAPMRNDLGIVQLCRIDVTDGQIEQLTQLEHSLAGQISVHPKGTGCSLICDERICLVDATSGHSHWLTERSRSPLAGSIHFAGENRFVFNRYVGNERERWLQVFVGEMD